MNIISEIPYDIVVWYKVMDDEEGILYANNLGIFKRCLSQYDTRYSDNPSNVVYFLEKENEDLVVYALNICPTPDWETIYFYKIKVGKIFLNQYNEVVVEGNYETWNLENFSRNRTLLYELNCKIISNMSDNIKESLLSIREGLSLEKAYSTFKIFAANAHKYFELLIQMGCSSYIVDMFKGNFSRKQLEIPLTKKLVNFSLQYKCDISVASSLFNKYSHSQLEKLAKVLEHYKLFSMKTYQDGSCYIWKCIDESPIEDFSLYCNYFVKSLFFNGNIALASYTVHSTGVFFEMYRDYLNLIDAEKRYGNGNNVFDLYPDNLKLAHDTANERKDILKEAKETQEKEESFKKATKKYSYLAYENKTFKVVIPSSPFDLLEESKVLHHCVKTYINYVCKETSKICLVRKLTIIDEKPSFVPYMTIEVRDDKIIQAKKKCNELPNEDDIKFLKEWSKEKNLIISNY